MSTSVFLIFKSFITIFKRDIIIKLLFSIIFVLSIFFVLERNAEITQRVLAAGTPKVDITLSVFSDGTPIFDSVDCNSDGNDCGANNGRVRTNDDIQYQVEVNLNEENANNTKFTLTLDSNQFFYQIPSVCLTSGVTPISPITNL